MRIEPRQLARAASVAIALAACGESSPTESLTVASLNCSIPTSEIFDGGPGKDGIPALVDPPLVGVGENGTEYLRDADRVIGIEIGDQPIAVPLNIGWWHEIVNINRSGAALSVTHCPLTGSSLAFDRAAAGGATFGVSGLLYRNNLIMYDRNRPESLWPQMSRGARCGPRNGVALTMVPILEMTWLAWRNLYPNTLVVSGNLNQFRDYTRYPYGAYDRVGNETLLFPQGNLDRRRALKERVLGIPELDGKGAAFPFGALDALGATAVVRYEPASDPAVVVFWSRSAQAAAAFRPVARGTPLDFEVLDGVIRDRQTSSRWDLDGRARSGPLSGERLEPIPTAYVAFWFAWAAFQPESVLWTGGPP